MAKKSFSNITLTVSLQAGSNLEKKKCIHGLLSLDANECLFEEEVKVVKPHTRNPKLYDGKLVSLVRREDNTIQFAFKSIKDDFDPENYPFSVYQEVTKAVKQILSRRAK